MRFFTSVPQSRQIWLVLLVPILMVVGNIALFFSLNGGVYYFTPAVLGALGDSFGGLSALFSGLAFAGLIVTLVMQGQQLQLQRHEIRLQRRELRLQRDEMVLARGETEKIAAAQSRAAEIARLVALIHECESRIALFTDPQSGVNVKPAIGAALQGWNFEKELSRKNAFIRELVEMD